MQSLLPILEKTMINFVRRCGEAHSPLGSLPGWMASLLRARGMDTEEKARRFLHPSLEDLHDPYALQDMDKTVSLIRAALAAGQRMLVYGDYDVDGVCASSIMMETLRELGGHADVRIPSRHSEGYGLHEEAIREAAAEYQLLITVDCGITNIKEVALAKSLGMTVIVTDHHEPPETLPPADAVMDPLLGSYPFRRLCGAGVALKICQALLGLPGVEKRLDLAALATVADVVPLVDENRVIVQEGMLRMAASSRPGLRALMETAGITPPLRSEHLAFRLGPRLNAAGRLEDALQAVALLTTQDPAEAARIAHHLEDNNRARQQAEQEILAEALRQVDQDVCFREERIIIVQGENWNSGLIGLVAGRLCERYHFPVIVLSVQGENAVGSCRSIPGVNIYRMLSQCGDLFVRFGGHEQAAGLTIPVPLIPELRRRLNLLLRSQTEDAVYLPALEYDLSIPFRELTLDTLSLLDALEPTGYGNPPPVFLVSDARVQEMRRVGADRSHLKLSLLDGDGTVLDGIAFSQGHEADRGYSRVDALFTPSRNEYRGRVSVQLMVQALRPCAAGLRLPSEEACFSSFLRALPMLGEATPDDAQGAANCPGPLAATDAPMKGKAGGYTPLNRTAALEQLRRPMGVLALTHDPALAADWARESGADLHVGAAEDPRSFSCVLLCWEPEALRDQWDRVIFADGAPLPGEGEWVRTHCPHAELCCLKSAPDRRDALASLSPSDDRLREVYKLLRAHTPPSAAIGGRLASASFSSLSALAEASGLSWQQMLIALQAFQDTHLVSAVSDPFSVSLILPARKCAMTDSPLIRFLRAL